MHPRPIQEREEEMIYCHEVDIDAQPTRLLKDGEVIQAGDFVFSEADCNEDKWFETGNIGAKVGQHSNHLYRRPIRTAIQLPSEMPRETNLSTTGQQRTAHVIKMADRALEAAIATEGAALTPSIISK